MALIPAKCTQCGATIKVDDTKEAGICESCGTAFITEKAINNFNVTNNINVSNATINMVGGDIDNLLVRAQQHEERGDYETAKEYYNRILDIDANHEIAKTKVFSLSKPYIGNVAIDARKLATIEENIRKGERISAVKMARELGGLGLADAAHFVDNFDTIDKTIPQSYSSQTGLRNVTNSSSGCYVATCVYGTYDCPEVWTLRRFRDNILAETWYGRAFISTYYAISPTLVKWFDNTKWFKKMWHGTLDKMVNGLQSKGVENTPYQD